MSLPGNPNWIGGSRGSSPMKIRGPTIITPSPIMPSPTGAPWNVADMPWSVVGQHPNIMEFKAPPINNVYIDQWRITPVHCKRKAQEIEKIENEVPAKQLITEEKIAAHFHNLHISPEYMQDEALTSNDVNNYNAISKANNDTDMMVDTDNCTFNIKMSQKELENKLKNVQRIKVCDEILKLNKKDILLPMTLIDKIERPCTALVLWQPPANLSKLIVPKTEELSRREENEEQDNNNSSSIDYNSMDLDL